MDNNDYKPKKMKNINEYFEDHKKEENWANTDLEVIDQKTFLKAILISFAIVTAVLIILSGIGYTIIQNIK